ncbi:hypothetical protein HY090_00080 [Candidatus Kaiserbacteria bacterium]|nr:hypothetical protein [Candidatus Kaiserbacteria bacterium]
MKGFVPFLKRHAWAIVVAAAVMLLVESPLFIFPFLAGARYQGVDTVGYFDTDTHYYLARAHEVLEGNGLGSAVIAGDKQGQDLSFNNIEFVLMAPVKLFHIDRFLNLPTIYNLYNAAIVFAIVLVVYALLLGLSGDSVLAITAAGSLIAGSTVLLHASLFPAVSNLYGRMPYPCIESLVFFLFAYFLYRAISGSTRLRDAGIAAGLLGFSCFLSLYGWTFAFAFSGIFCVVLLALRKYPEAVTVFGTAALGAVLGLPALIPLVLFKLSPVSAQSAYFYNALESHAPFWSTIGVLSLVLFAGYAFFFGKSDNRVSLAFVGALPLAGLLIVNQQVITGWSLQNEHYYWYFLLPGATIAGIYAVFKVIRPAWRPWLSAVILGGFLVSLAVNQYLALKVAFPEELREQDYAALMPALSALPQGGVLTALDEGSRPQTMLVPILTNKDLLWSRVSLFQSISMDRVEDIMLFYIYLDIDARRDPIAYLKNVITGPLTPMQYLYKSVEGSRSGLAFDVYEHGFIGGDATGAAAIAVKRQTFFAELLNRYRALFPNDAAARKWLQDQGVRYVLWDEEWSPEWDIAFLKPFTQVQEGNQLSLYELH